MALKPRLKKFRKPSTCGVNCSLLGSCFGLTASCQVIMGDKSSVQYAHVGVPVTVEPALVVAVNNNTFPTNQPLDVRRREGLKEPKCCSCARGGGFRQAPAKFMVDQWGRTVRVNLLFEAQNCCGPSPGLVDDIPEELFVNGLEHDKEALIVLLRNRLPDVNRGRTGACCDITAFIATLAFSFVPGVLCCFCSAAKAQFDAWDMRLRQWTDDANRKIFQKYGMLLKTQSRCDAVYRSQADGSTAKDRHTERWLAVALTPDEAYKLSLEPHLVGDIDDAACCGGPNEHAYSMHP